MAIVFYNVKKRTKVSIDEKSVKKVTYDRDTAKGKQTRYAVKATDDDGTNLTKFCSKADWDAINAPKA